MKKFDKTDLGIIYGPVMSRRFGTSLGINLAGNNKTCSFNCFYCFRGPNRTDCRNSVPDKADVLEAILSFLGGYRGDRFSNWTIAGSGEPTDNPQFPEIIEALIAMRNHLCPDAKLSLLTNGMGFLPGRNLHFKDFLAASELVDRIYLKIDSGLPATWQKLNRPEEGTTFSEWFSAIRQLPAPMVQTVLVQGVVDNTTNEEIEALLSSYRKLGASRVRIDTFHHTPAGSGLKPVPHAKVKLIRQEISRSMEFVSAR